MLRKRFVFALLSLGIGIALILLYIFLKKEEESVKNEEEETSITEKKQGGVLVFKETIQSPKLRSTFNYVNDPQKDGSTGRLTYAGSSDMTRWGIGITEFTHVKFPNGMVFKLRKPNSSDTYGYFVDEKNNKIRDAPNNFFGDFIQLGTFS